MVPGDGSGSDHQVVTAGAVIGIAAVAAVASYELVRAYGEAGSSNAQCARCTVMPPIVIIRATAACCREAFQGSGLR